MNRNAMRIILCVAGATLFTIGLVGGLWWARHSLGAGTQRSGTAESAAKERKVLYWYDAMAPDQHFDKPGKSPFMDMQLIPKYADETEVSGVRIVSSLQQNVGIRTAVVEIGTLASMIRVPGVVTWDLREEVVVSARADGIVTWVGVKTPSEPVHRGQVLATLLAPEWSSALAEAQALGDSHSTAAHELREAAQERLRVLGVTGHNGRGGVALMAPGAGVVSEVLVREGQTVMQGTPLFRINGTETLWLEAAIPQAGVASIRPGTPATATISALPGKTFEGEVERLLPVIDAVSRTQQARIVLRNPDGVLAPGMLADVTLQPETGSAVALIPNEALIATGDDSRVIVQTAQGEFRPVRVRTGRSSGGRTEVLAGLNGGERVVVSGQFLIDSEASLSGALTRMSESPPTAQAAMPKREDAIQATSHQHAAPEPIPDLGIQQATRTKPSPEPHGPTRAAKAPPSGTCTVSYWYDPMVPDQRFDKPGKSPFMDMQLVPKFASDSASDCTIRDVKRDGGEARP